MMRNRIGKLFRKPLVRNILSALAIAFFGFVLLNLTFLFDFIYQSAVGAIIGLFTPIGPGMGLHWYPPLTHVSFIIIIGIISWRIFRSGLKVIYKASYLTVPVAVVLATIGMFLYRWQIISYTISTLLCISTLYWFYRTKQPWLYSYAVVLVALTLAIFTLLGGEI